MLHNEQKQQAALQKGLPVFYYYSSDPFLARAAAEKTAAALLREEGGEYPTGWPGAHGGGAGDGSGNHLVFWNPPHCRAAHAAALSLLGKRHGGIL